MTFMLAKAATDVRDGKKSRTNMGHSKTLFNSSKPCIDHTKYNYTSKPHMESRANPQIVL